MEHKKDITEEPRREAQKDDAPREQANEDHEVPFQFTDWASL